MPKEQAAISTEYVIVPVDVVPPDADVGDDLVELAFVRGRDLTRPPEPATADWKTAVWLRPAGRLSAAVNVGPGGTVQLTRGDWIVWVRIHDNPETPTIAADVLTIT